MSKIQDIARELAAEIAKMSVDDQVKALNEVRELLHQAGPFFAEPVDLVLWVHVDNVIANDYNPNAVAPPEMELLRHSIRADGYTQPIVTYPQGEQTIVVDGYHRNRVGREDLEIRDRIHGYLPVTRINADRESISDRMAATIRHNRARGAHSVDKMSAIVRDLYKAGWSDKQIQKELGMQADEVIRMKQITGLAALFKDREFSEAWVPDK